MRRRHYHSNKDQYFERNRLDRAAKVAYVREVKSRPCADCGQSYPPYVMDFDHRDPSKKVAAVAVLMRSGWNKLKEEIAKCDVVCSNCHRERTHGHDSL